MKDESVPNTSEVAKSPKPDEMDRNPIDSKSLEELIRDNNGQDVELHFYYEGRRLENSMCFYEVWKQF